MRRFVAIAAAFGLGIAMAAAQPVPGPGPAQKSNALSLDQVVKLSNIITNEKAAPLFNINFSVSIDSVVPAQINLQPLPSNVNELVPQFSGHAYIVVEELIAIVDPKTRKIAAVVPRSRSQ